MPNWCSNHLIITGPTGQLKEFKDYGSLDLMGGPNRKDLDHKDTESGSLEYFYRTPGDPKLEIVERVSKQFPDLSFQHYYGEPLADYSGYAVYSSGHVIRRVQASRTGSITPQIIAQLDAQGSAVDEMHTYSPVYDLTKAAAHLKQAIDICSKCNVGLQDLEEKWVPLLADIERSS